MTTRAIDRALPLESASPRRADSMQFGLVNPRTPAKMHRRGVALVITMILLAVITTLAIAFLALTYRETGAVDSKARTTDAELGADSALERAKAQIVSEMLLKNVDPKHPDIMGPDLIVSVPWQTNRLAPGAGNLFYDPTPPVFIDTNRGNGITLEDRFYLDLNRNTNYEETGWVQVRDRDGTPIAFTTNWVVGDPIWIGLLRDPSRPHSADNPFIARYAFLIQPIGRTLDVNWIHNQALENLDSTAWTMEDAGASLNGFYRNQGIGPWEMNLAGFLADLNTNFWGNYEFHPLKRWPSVDPLNAFAPPSSAFNDARELLRYRYLPLPLDPSQPPPVSPRQYNDTMNALLPFAGTMLNDGVYAYANTLVQPSGPAPVDNDDPSKPWPGSDSKRHFYTPHDYFDARKLPEQLNGGFQFRKHLHEASAQPGTYDQYTYYRMLAQLGTDSAPGESGKINLNFMNIGSWKDGRQLFATDMVSWTNLETSFRVIRDNLADTIDMGRPGPELFLLAVATNMFRRESELKQLVDEKSPGRIRIPVFLKGSRFSTNGWPLYSGRIHQILKVAANILEAMRPDLRTDGPEYPLVFMPVFARGNPNGKDDDAIYIVDYVLVKSYKDDIAPKLWRDLGNADELQKVAPNDGVYGIPFIVGARKGYPTFNEVAVKTDVQAVRRLVVTRGSASGPLETNQSFVLAVTNRLAFEAWNSYTSNAYPRPLRLYFGARTSVLITNSDPVRPVFNLTTNADGVLTSLVQRAWQPWKPPAASGPDFLWHRLTNYYRFYYTNVGPLDVAGTTNRWFAAVTNAALYFLVDDDHVVDAVTMSGPTNLFDIAGLLHSPNSIAVGSSSPFVWSNRRLARGNHEGIMHQMIISTTEDPQIGPNLASDNDWRDYSPEALSRYAAIKNFNAFFKSNDLIGQAWAPFAAGRRMEQETHFAVNDPLVHFTMEDFTRDERTATVRAFNNATFDLGTRNFDFAPWGATTPLEPVVIDPGVEASDAWEFPTNRFPSVGWLGRVHRATPWQTLYLKSDSTSVDKWANSAGRVYSKASKVPLPDAASMLPTNDWRMADIFTTEIHPHASRGRLSINQTNAAAWAALLAGVVSTAVTNDNGVALPVAVPVEPEAVVPGVREMVARINDKRGTNQFTRLSDILSVRAFTTDYLTNLGGWFPGFDPMNPPPNKLNFKLHDSDYERIPEQVLGLLKVGEARFAVYAWGQSLKPARFGVTKNGRNVERSGPSILTADVQGVGDRGTVMNYQVTGEAATRTILNVEFERDNNNQPIYSRPRIVVESFNVLPNE